MISACTREKNHIPFYCAQPFCKLLEPARVRMCKKSVQLLLIVRVIN
jgi:hypothetical protein